MQTLNATVIPVLQIFSLIGVGWLLANPLARIIGSPKGDFWNHLVKLVYMVSLPALILDVFADFRWQQEHGITVIAAIIMTAAMVVVTLFIAAMMPFKKEEKTVIASIAYHPNSMFLGFPLIIAVMTTHALPIAALYCVVEFPIATMASIFVLNLGKQKGKEPLTIVLRQMIQDPVVWSCLVGIGWSVFQIPLPQTIQQPLHWLGGLASPLALLVIGARMRIKNANRGIGSTAVIGCLKLAIAPAIAFLVAGLMGLGAESTTTLTLLMAAPVAVSTVLLVEQHGADTELTANAITLTTLVSLITLAVAALILK